MSSKMFNLKEIKVCELFHRDYMMREVELVQDDLLWLKSE